jgi:hypothetical protein
MAKLALQSYHQLIEEAIAWLEYLEETGKPSDRDWLIFSKEVLPRFTNILPDFISALNQASSDPLDGEPSRFRGLSIEKHRVPKSKISYELISARIRRLPGSELRQRQCIGPIVGERGHCVGKGAATAGWQSESPENFARKRNNFQARCKACDTLRTQGRQFKLTRRSSAARHWLEIAERSATENASITLQAAFLDLSISFLEELRNDWWTTLQHLAQRLIDVSGHLPKEAWLAVDVDRKLIFSGASPKAAKNNGQLEGNLLILFRGNQNVGSRDREGLFG